MANVVGLLISARSHRIIGLVLGLITFAALLLASGYLANYEIHRLMMRASHTPLYQFTQLRQRMDDTFTDFKAQVTATPCSTEFLAQLRRIAYRNSGFSEFLYAPGGVVQCSGATDFRAHPIPLGEPDLRPELAGRAELWMDRGLGAFGLEGLVGTIAMRGAFGIIVPPQPIASDVPSWLRMEIVLVEPDGRYWHRSGETGLFKRYRAVQENSGQHFNLAFYDYACVLRSCAVLEATPVGLLTAGWTYLVLAIGGAAAVSAWIGIRGHAVARRYWSFEARFVRHFGEASIVCVYQPIMELESGRIAGCEVLARWRDVDGSIVYPDSFIPLVEKNALTVRLTQLVVDRALQELSTQLPKDCKLFVSFNIFPRDLDAAILVPIFEAFAPMADRFAVVVELVESDAVVAEAAQHEIELLRGHGIRTFIDDFGTGYSNIENLAALSVDGVKLDRAFAMAPDESMMSQMLRHVIGMVHITGRRMIVEGVETQERLLALRQVKPPIDYVQGYYISRPLEIGRLADFLAARDTASIDLAA